VAEWRDPDQGMAALAAAIVGVVFINGIAIGRCSIRSCNPASTAIETGITSASAEKKFIGRTLRPGARRRILDTE